LYDESGKILNEFHSDGKNRYTESPSSGYSIKLPDGVVTSINGNIIKTSGGLLIITMFGWKIEHHTHYIDTLLTR